ncbi:MAG: hypothetical protein HOP15_04570 [Planctomycetes bacterium]|nr:hypothetical protein [Planctomycetota bacterium]
MAAMLALWPRLIAGLQPDEPCLRAAASDPKLRATERVLTEVQAGTPFRDAYRAESRAAEHR